MTCKQECMKQKKDGTLQDCPILKENEQLKEQVESLANTNIKAQNIIEELKNNYKKQRNKRIDELQKKNAELKKIIYNLVSAFNNYECAGPVQEQENTWEILSELMHDELFKIENGSLKNDRRKN